jgi:hypothetical protein
MAAWLLYERIAKAEGRRESYSLETLLSEEIPEGKTICNKEETNWHRHVELNGPGPEAYAAYNIAVIALEESLCSK